MSDLKPYPEYKDSGVEWLGVIPAGWEANKVGRVARFTVGWTPPTGDSASFAGNNLWANISDIRPKTLSETAKRISDDAVRAARISVSPVGSLLFSFKLSVGQVSFVGRDMYTNEAIATFLPNDGISLDYAYFAFPLFVVENASKNIYGAKILNQSLIRSARIPLPSLKEQRAIASFLDHETAEVDAFIADQEELIRLLNERRAATITQAVTKGLDPNVPMKDSGVEWLGELPADWVVRPLKAVASLQTGITLGKSYEESIELPYLRVANVQIGNVDLSTLKTIRVSADVARASTLQAGDVLMTEGGDRDKLGRGCLWNAPIDPCLHQNHVFAVRTGRKLANNFLVYSLDAAPARTYFHMTGKQTTNLAATNSTLVKNFRFALPPMPEQQQITEYLDRETAEIDATIADAKEAIALSKERRAALISAAVTGKIDVREHPAAKGAA